MTDITDNDVLDMLCELFLGQDLTYENLLERASLLGFSQYYVNKVLDRMTGQ